ncbi:MAG TPA: GNAT family N-acetyltransferase [Methanothrix sp.]|nr:GNAT family N-acetyltransferase [Methanothrix sp.]
MTDTADRLTLPAASPRQPPFSVRIRNNLLPGDVGCITYLHSSLYCPQQGWDHTFDCYVAMPLAEFALRKSPKERIWIVEQEGRVRGSAAIVRFEDRQAQLRWLLLQPDLRGRGLGRRLVEEALAFCRESGYESVFLWTVEGLPESVALYRSAGFVETEKVTHEMWGRVVTEVRYEMKVTTTFSPQRH